ncbi:MAG: hypothetical protein AB7D06_09265 [Pedobacter sp.]
MTDVIAPKYLKPAHFDPKKGLISLFLAVFFNDFCGISVAYLGPTLANQLANQEDCLPAFLYL